MSNDNSKKQEELEKAFPDWVWSHSIITTDDIKFQPLSDGSGWTNKNDWGWGTAEEQRSADDNAKP